MLKGIYPGGGMVPRHILQRQDGNFYIIQLSMSFDVDFYFIRSFKSCQNRKLNACTIQK
jgi:hypothetical protein